MAAAMLAPTSAAISSIVTGGASGLGLAVVESLARLEAVPVVFDMVEVAVNLLGTAALVRSLCPSCSVAGAGWRGSPADPVSRSGSWW